MVKLLVDAYRQHAEPMQIVSGHVGREKVHYEAPPSARVPVDMQTFLVWFNADTEHDNLASSAVDAALGKALFWRTHQDKALTTWQRNVINVLFDAGPNGFEEGMSTRKYESIGGTSRATASRELIELEDMGLLIKVGAGRSTRYYLNIPGWAPATEA